MKTYLFLLVVLLVSKSACAQFNKSVTYVLSQAATDTKIAFHLKGVSDDGYDYYSYNYNNGQAQLKVFYFKNDSCKFIKFVLKNEQLSDTINQFNKDYTNTGNNRWVDYSKNIEYIIAIQNNDPLFDVLMRPTIYYH